MTTTTMPTSNGLTVPRGWGRHVPIAKRACPVCQKGVELVAGPIVSRLAPHDRFRTTTRCPGSDRLADRLVV